jgi:hypothetical protein
MRLLPYVLLLLSYAASAQQSDNPPNLEPVPDGPPVVDESQAGPQQPEVTIRRGAEDTIKEYRINGRLYMVQITPSKGVPYFLVDSDGDGNLDTYYNDLDDRLMVPAWVILSW